jgi:hypothetical protein
MTPRPFTIHHSAYARDSLYAAISAATQTGRRADAVAAARVIERGLLWFADGFGESRQPLQVLGQLRCAVVLPLTIWFAVDIARWEVHVGRYRFAGRRPR